MGVIPRDKIEYGPVNQSMEDVESLLRKHDARVRGMARRFAVHVDDLAQVGRMALIDAAELWNSREGHTAEFWTYAYRRVLGAMRDYVSREAVKNFAVQDDEFWDSYMGGPWAAPDAACEAREHVARLDLMEEDVVLRHLAGEDIRSIANDLSISKSVVHRTYVAAMDELRKEA